MFSRLPTLWKARAAIPNPLLEVVGCDVEVVNVFSPNGDEQNDELVFQYLTSFPGNQLTVFDRWGNLVYQKSNYGNNWRGRRGRRNVLLRAHHSRQGGLDRHDYPRALQALDQQVAALCTGVNAACAVAPGSIGKRRFHPNACRNTQPFAPKATAVLPGWNHWNRPVGKRKVQRLWSH